MNALNREIAFLDGEIRIQESYIHRLEKLIGFPDTDQKKLRKQIAEAKRELARMNNKHAKLINQWAETERVK